MLNPDQSKQIKRETLGLWKFNAGCGCVSFLIAVGLGFAIWNIDSWWWRAPLILLLLCAVLVMIAASLLDIVPWAWAVLRFFHLAGSNWLEKRRNEDGGGDPPPSL
ncbi:hypothetical protein IT575_04015 [bacterium]|nr:hypothetical protein [bacterium]